MTSTTRPGPTDGASIWPAGRIITNNEPRTTNNCLSNQRLGTRTNARQLTVHLERAVLVSVALPDRPFLGDDPLDELRPGHDCRRHCRRRADSETRTHHSRHLHRQGQARGTTEQSVQAHDADVVIFDNDLVAQPGSQPRKSAERQGARPQRADPRHFRRAGPAPPKSRLQVELAQLEYSLPVCTRWTHLSRYSGGIGLRGPGKPSSRKTGRLVALQFATSSRRLAVVQSRNERAIASRTKERAHLPGRLHQRRQEHLDERPDRRRRAGRGQAVFHPRHPYPPMAPGRLGQDAALRHGRLHPRFAPPLVASFKATLEEARQARLLLHVVDASNPHAEQQILAVNNVLKELGCDRSRRCWC